MRLASMGTPGDSESPVVSILGPTGDSTIEGLVPIDVSATDNLGVARVEVLANGVLLGSDDTSPYMFVWDSTVANDGNATLVARAYDAAGNRGTSATVTVQVVNAGDDTEPPRVTITSPANGSTVSGTISLAAFATDNDQVSELRIYVDGALKCAGSTSASCSWTARKKDAGDHTVMATAKDVAGQTASASVSVTVGGGGKGGGKDGGGGGGKGRNK